jgi:DNA-binding transcriptional LysR family regulator
MKISNLNLSAFYQCAQTLNVSAAAAKLGLTQSALSQRLQALESDLETTLFIRDPKGLILTPEGHEFLRYAETTENLETEFLNSLKGSALGGSVRIAGFSSIMRSKIIPTLAPFLRENPAVKIDFQSHEVADLPQVLATSRADFVILDYGMKKKSIKEEVLFQEEYVVIESAKYKSPSDIYLDHGPQDNATEDYFRAQEKANFYRRSFMGDVYGIIQGVEEGLGRAVMSRHLVEENKKVKILKGFKKFQRPVTLHYYERAYYPKLHQMILEKLT